MMSATRRLVTVAVSRLVVLLHSFVGNRRSRLSFEKNSKIHEANMDKCYKLSLWELQLEVMRIRERFAVQSYEASILARAQSIIGRLKHAQTQQSPIGYLQPSNQEPQERLPLSDACTRSPQ